MITNKKGLSAVVGTILIILLVIVAVGIVWAVAGDLFRGSGSQVEYGARCLAVEMDLTANCEPKGVLPADWVSICTVILNRNDAGEDFSGVKLVFSNATENNITTIDENIEALGMKTITDYETPLTNVSKIEVTVYFEDEVGAEYLCPQPADSVSL